MSVISPMTAVAVTLHILECARDMTRLAWHDNVETEQRKISQIVIEMHIVSPAIWHVAGVTLGAELTAVDVGSAVTRNAFAR